MQRRHSLAVANRNENRLNQPAPSRVTSTAMRDDKRLLRQLKRDIKRAGNRKRRRYLKDVNAEADDFSFGRMRSDVMCAFLADDEESTAPSQA